MHSEIQQLSLSRFDNEKASQILETCVHCGFCLATCPTYQLLGDELDSPRGLINVECKFTTINVAVSKKQRARERERERLHILV